MYFFIMVYNRYKTVHVCTVELQYLEHQYFEHHEYTCIEVSLKYQPVFLLVLSFVHVS